MLSLARSTIFSSTTAVSSSVSVQRTRPLGGGEQARVIGLARPHRAPLIASTAYEWIRALVDKAERVAISERIIACRDATDDKFLEWAMSDNADLILSGDKDLPMLQPFRGIPIVAPAIFVLGG